MNFFFFKRWVRFTASILLMLTFYQPLFAQGITDNKETALEGVNAAEVEVIRREEARIAAQILIKEAQNAVAEGNYQKALNSYEDAQKRLANAPASSTEITLIHKGASLCLFQLAKDAYDRKEYAQALEQAQKAYQLDPENQDAASLVEQALRENGHLLAHQKEEEKAAAEVPKEISNSEFAAKQKKVLELYRAGENYFKSEQFDQAESALKEILRIDPYSATAYHRLREVQLAKYKKLDAAKQQTEAQSILDVQEAWKMPLRREKGAIPIAGETEGLLTEGEKTGIMKKLNSIVIKKIEFENTPILSAITYLINESREADVPAHVGINIIPAFTSPATPGEVPPGGAATISPSPATSGITANLNVHNLSILQAIKYLTQVTGLKYRIEPDAVVIVSSSTPEGQLQTRTFNVAPGVFRPTAEKTEGGSESAAHSGGGGFTGLGAGGTFGTRSTDVKKIFEDYGVSFPPGTSISYNESHGILVVRHTNEVIDQIDQIIYQLNKTPAQVQIEAKFIDVKQSDLEELGFRWAFAPATQQQYTIESGQGTSLPSLPIGGPYRGIGNLLTGGNRGASSLSVSALDALLAGSSGSLITAGADTVLTVTGVLTNPQLQVMINALSQKGLTNLLSAPRITTTSGEKAQILVTREFIYPSTFTDPVVSAGTSSNTGGTGSVGIVAPSPSAFTTRDIGVVLNVKPNVGSDNRTINMELQPEVLDFEGFINYNTFAVANTTSFTFTLPQPVFNKRRVETNVIIWDGQTVLLGGLIREDVTKVNDKVPFLGDIPIVGRLFQSKVESSTKRNLIIFLTARIVDPAGNPVNKMQEVRFDVPIEAPQ